MEPNPETCGELFRAIRGLFALKQVALRQIGDDGTALHPAAVALLSELVHSGECRASDLAQHRFVDASVVSRQVAQLERDGLIARRPGPSDRRVTLLRATPKGRQTLADLYRQQCEWLSQTLHGWDDDRVRRLSEEVEALSHHIRDSVSPPRTHPASTDKQGA